MEYPFQEKKVEDKYHRLFLENLDSDDLVWHRDAENRIIQSVSETDWMIQLDNELPQSLNEKVFIPQGVWHRLIKGRGNLSVIIDKYDE